MPTRHSPEDDGPPEAGRPVAAPVSVPKPAYRWYHKLSAVLLITLCTYVGLFLALFPWTYLWDINYFSQVAPAWHEYWGNRYLRGAVSGVGVLNIYLAVVEVFRLRRFSKRP